MDTIETIAGALVQHGSHNDRVYIMKVPGGDPAGATALLEKVHLLARERGYGKVFARIPESWWPVFAKAGYRKEAVVPDYFRGNSACVFAARFVDPKRAVEREQQRLDDVMESCRNVAACEDESLDPAFVLAPCSFGHAGEMADLFHTVFTSYPFPVHDPAFIVQAMGEGTRYLGARWKGRLVALASLEPDSSAPAAEMGDFATLPASRGKGLARHLLARMDRLAAEMGRTTTFTIARARSFGMNRVFARCGYRYAGRLVNNTQIAGSIQSMNVWYKRL